MSDPESVAKWLQIRNNSLKLLSLGENPGRNRQMFSESKSKHSIMLLSGQILRWSTTKSFREVQNRSYHLRLS